VVGGGWGRRRGGSDASESRARLASECGRAKRYGRCPRAIALARDNKTKKKSSAARSHATHPNVAMGGERGPQRAWRDIVYVMGCGAVARRRWARAVYIYIYTRPDNNKPSNKKKTRWPWWNMLGWTSTGWPLPCFVWYFNLALFFFFFLLDFAVGQMGAMQQVRKKDKEM